MQEAKIKELSNASTFVYFGTIATACIKNNIKNIVLPVYE
jgi:hypothetical protein